MINRLKAILLQSTIIIRLFRFIESKFIEKPIDVKSIHSFDLHTLKKEYVKNGIVVIKGFFAKDVCGQILEVLISSQKNYEDNISAGKFKGIQSEKNFSDDSKRAVYWYNFADQYEVINKIVDSQPLHSLCEYLISAKAKKITYWIKQVDGDAAKNAKNLTNEKYHADSVGLNAIRALVYLNDVNSETNGPFYYIKQTHLDKPILTTIFPSKVEKYCKKAEPILGEAGDVILVDVNGYHKAGRPESGFRNTLQILYVSETADYLNHLFNYTTYVKESKK